MATATPFFLETGAGRLFCCHHAPLAERPAPVLLVCPPIGHEHIRAHRTLRQLAARLAAQGFHTVRFDYFGCGDSDGEDGEGSVERWREDIVSVMAAARERSGQEAVGAIGVRLGASLAATVGASAQELEVLVLWEPVVNGRVYVERLEQGHRQRVATFPSHVTSASRSSRHEILGFALSESLLAGVGAVDLNALPARPATHVLLVDDPESVPTGLAARLGALGSVVDERLVSTRTMWVEDINRVVVSQEVLSTVVSWLEELYR